MSDAPIRAVSRNGTNPSLIAAFFRVAHLLTTTSLLQKLQLLPSPPKTATYLLMHVIGSGDGVRTGDGGRVVQRWLVVSATARH